MTRTTYTFFLLATATLMMFGCSPKMDPDVVRGSSYQYRGGFPEVRLSAIGFIDQQDRPQINIAADIVYGSLIYRERNGVQTSNIAIEIRILDQENPENIIKTDQFSLSIEKEDANITYSQDVFTFEKQIDVEPGDYQVNVTVIDQSSGKQTTRTSSTYIPNPEDEISNLTNIRLLGKDSDDREGSWLPVTTYDVQGKIDSLKFVFQVTNNRPEQPITINTRLLRYDSDTTVARPMHFNNYSPSSIAYKGIDYNDEEELQSSRRVLNQPGSVLVEFLFPMQERGNYRFEVTTQGDEGDEEASLFKARDFGIKSANYPSVQTAREMAQPLIYLMDEDEHEQLMAMNNPDSIKSSIDRFWLRNVGNTSKARGVIEMFYSRVEEANKQFSNFKEGWKTDPGMIYILFGPPWYVEDHLDVMIWSYSYDRRRPDYNYNYRQPKFNSKYFPFNHYILQRSQQYFNVQYQQIQLWLTGMILTRSI